MSSILVIVAHSDDEAIGCGGVIAKHVASGDEVSVVYMADGVTSRGNVKKADIAERGGASAQAQKILNLKGTYHLDFPDNKMDNIPLLDIVQALEPVIQNLQPEIIYTHHYGDLNVDHRITHQATMTACRPVPGSCIREIYSFEVMSSTEWSAPTLLPFLPNYYVDITKFIDVKIDAVNAYTLEMRPAPHSRSVEHVKQLAFHRGASVGVDAAEAFMMIRCLK